MREPGSEALRLHYPVPYGACASRAAPADWLTRCVLGAECSQHTTGDRREARKNPSFARIVWPEVGADTCLKTGICTPSPLKGVKCDTGGGEGSDQREFRFRVELRFNASYALR